MATLAELKATNAADENKAEGSTQGAEVEEESTEVEEEAQELDTAGESDQEPEEEVEGEEGETSETESWMQADDKASESDDTTVPLAAHTKMRGKLKARIGEKDEELATLKAEVEALKNGAPVAPAQPAMQAMPTLEGSDFDDAKYQQALSNWMSQQVSAQVAAATQATTTGAAKQAQVQQLQKSVDSHYERAAKLASESGIEPEVYQASDMAVRQAIESALPEMGDLVADQLISKLGDGSEKVMYYLGRNATAREKLKTTLLTDPSGISAALYLGELKRDVAIPSKRKSRAPAPATKVQGDQSGTSSGNAKKLLKKYQQAHKERRSQMAYNVKKEAKIAGVDVSNW